MKTVGELAVRRILQCKRHPLELDKRTLIMGILNVTPDSFSDGGLYNERDAAIRHAVQMVEDGADLIDVGGESTRPGSKEVSLDEELTRVIPIIEALSRHIEVPISIDTYKYQVADEAINAGAEIINDVWGMKKDVRMASVAVKHDCPLILMHNRDNAEYREFPEDVFDELEKSIQLALAEGVRGEQILVDPGIGFGKTMEHNLYFMNHLDRFVAMGYPILLGTSRKSMIHKTLGMPPTEVLEGTIVTTALGIAQGCDIVRVHDVKQMKKAVIMADAIRQRRHSFGVRRG